MSEQQPGSGEWYQASDGKFYAGPPPNQSTADEPPKWFHDKDQRRFERDPTGRYSYRSNESGRWGSWVSDGPGSDAKLDPDGAREAASLKPPSYVSVAPKSDGVAPVLEAFGWICVILSVLGGIALYADSQDYYSDTPVGLAFAVGAAGVVQGLLLVGFGRIVGYMSETAGQTRRSADLIERSLSELG